MQIFLTVNKPLDTLYLQVLTEGKMNAYVLDRPQKGVAIIINNLHNEQPGTQKDVTSLEKMFQAIRVNYFHLHIQ